jgi:hypothetical protein
MMCPFRAKNNWIEVEFVVTSTLLAWFVSTDSQILKKHLDANDFSQIKSTKSRFDDREERL